MTRALFFVAANKVELRSIEVSDLEPGEVLVRTVYSGISSGTEMLVYRGLVDAELPLDERFEALGGTFSYPFQYGYSCVGVVEQPRESRLNGSLVFAFHPHQELFSAPESEVLVIPAVSPRVATLFPLVETALQISLEVEEIGPGPTVVIGLGAVGTLIAALMEQRGRTVIGVELSPWRIEAAQALGIDAVAPEAAQDVVRRQSGRGAAVVVEASGHPDALASALDLLRHEGTALVASWYGLKLVSLPLGGAFHRRRLTIRSTQVSTIPAQLASRWTVRRRREAALELLGRLPVEALATHEFPFASAASAYEALDRGEEGLLHAALSYDQATRASTHV
ncbi:MAG: zinc-binding alcohol dehydrogenase [Actinomycetota bacterium]|nr:zinc-binding alcohol dehydrogenase [Actinomycetota bacterium]